MVSHHKPCSHVLEWNGRGLVSSKADTLPCHTDVQAALVHAAATVSLTLTPRTKPEPETSSISGKQTRAVCYSVGPRRRSCPQVIITPPGCTTSSGLTREETSRGQGGQCSVQWPARAPCADKIMTTVPFDDPHMEGSVPRNMRHRKPTQTLDYNRSIVLCNKAVWMASMRPRLPFTKWKLMTVTLVVKGRALTLSHPSKTLK